MISEALKVNSNLTELSLDCGKSIDLVESTNFYCLTAMCN